MTGKEIRMARLFNGNQNAVIVAADHGEFDGPIEGMANLPKILKSIYQGVDGVLLSPGMVERCAHVFSAKDAPVAVMRLNWSTIYCFHWDYISGATVPVVTAKEAVARGADIALVSLTLQTGSEERDAKNIEVYCRLSEDAHSLGLPVIGEFFPPKIKEVPTDAFHDQIKTGCRIISELGADMIKTFHTNRFREVVEGCPVPVFGLGAEKAKTQLEALKLAQREIKEGAKGVVFGRNAIQVPNPVAFQKALCEVVKKGIAPKSACKKYGLKD